jgi:hypothetical protein
VEAAVTEVYALAEAHATQTALGVAAVKSSCQDPRESEAGSRFAAYADLRRALRKITALNHAA